MCSKGLTRTLLMKFLLKELTIFMANNERTKELPDRVLVTVN